jgi:hypothetical protein
MAWNCFAFKTCLKESENAEDGTIDLPDSGWFSSAISTAGIGQAEVRSRPRKLGGRA